MCCTSLAQKHDLCSTHTCGVLKGMHTCIKTNMGVAGMDVTCLGCIASTKVCMHESSRNGCMDCVLVPVCT